jgi:hypothetical protein
VSEVFEGVIVPVQAASFAEARGREQGLVLETQHFDGDLSAIYRSDPRVQAVFSPIMDTLAAEASKRAGRALVARYDSRMGTRSSALFENGQQKQLFGEADELYVPLDESGSPVDGAKPLTVANLDPNEEYETTVNAIQLGLQALGGGSWKELYRLIMTI